MTRFTIEERELLKTKTDDELNQMLESIRIEMSNKEEERKTVYNQIVENRKEVDAKMIEIVSPFLTDDSMELIFDGHIERPYDWETRTYGQYKYSATIGLRRKSNESKWREEEIEFEIMPDHIAMRTTGYSTFTRNERPCLPILLAIQGMVWSNEQTIVEAVKSIVNTQLIEKHTQLKSEYWDIERNHDVVRDELSRRADIKEANEHIEKLKNGKYYHFLKEDKWHKVERWYKIIKVSAKTVKMIEIEFSSWWPDDFICELDNHNFKLYEDVLQEMHRGQGTVVNDVNDQIAEAKAEYDERQKAKEQSEDAQ